MTAAWLAGAWLAGVVGGALGGRVPWEPAVAAGLLLAAVALALRRPALCLLALPCAGLVLLGGLRFDGTEPSPGAIAALAGQQTTFRAVVLDEPDESAADLQARVSVREVLTGDTWQPSSGGVLLRLPPGTRLHYGDLLEVTSKLRLPPASEEFDYRQYLLQRGVGVIADRPEVEWLEGGHGNPLLAGVNAVRRRLGDALSDALPEPQAALARGILLGQRSAIPDDLTDDMNAAGVSHLVAISGYNVSLLAGLVVGLLAWAIGRRQASLVAMAVVAAYSLLVGAGPPVIRAAIMGSLFLLAGMAGRPGSAGTSILLAAAAMTAWQPRVVQDVSFQLSFASIVAIAYFSGPAIRWLEWAAARAGLGGATGVRALLVEPLGSTLPAVVGTLPLIALTFHRASLVSLPANVVLVPAFPLILVTSAAVAITGLASATLAGLLGWFAWVSLSFFTEASGFFGGLPGSSLDVAHFGTGQAAFAYVLAALAGVALLRLPRPAVTASPRGRPLPAAAPWLGLAAVAVVALVWWMPGNEPDGRLHLTVLDVGEGDALLITGPDGRRVLVDGGRSGEQALAALGRRLGYRERSLAGVLLTHPDLDHSGGLTSVLRRYRVGAVAAGPESTPSTALGAWATAVAEAGLRMQLLEEGRRIDLGGGATAEVLWPPADAPAGDNENSVVLRLTWRRVSFLLTADIPADTEESLLEAHAPLAAQVLKVAHHGSGGSSSDRFLLAVHPSVALISVGENTFGHPSPAVIDRLQPAVVYRTDQSGDVDVATDGRRIWVTTGR